MTGMLGPRNFGAILGDTFKIYGENFLRLLAIVAIVEVILGILGSVLTLPAIWTNGKIESLPAFIVIGIILFVGSIVAYPLMQGALIHAISEQHFRRPVSIGRAYSFAWRRIGALIGATILATLAILALTVTIIGIPAAIYFAVTWTFIWQAALIDGSGPRAALARSSALVRQNWWRVLGIMLVVGIIAGAIAAVLGTIPVVGSTIGSILSIPIAITGATLLYYDLRVRKEGYSLEALAEELGTKIDSDVA
jgi:hypothetical protein